MDVHRSRAQCLLRLGDLANKKGSFSDATEFWIAARPYFERSSQAKDVTEIDDRLAELEQKQKSLLQPAALHPPKNISTELLDEVEKVEIENGMAAGQGLSKGPILPVM
jgi:hypothetical protein